MILRKEFLYIAILMVAMCTGCGTDSDDVAEYKKSVPSEGKLNYPGYVELHFTAPPEGFTLSATTWNVREFDELKTDGKGFIRKEVTSKPTSVELGWEQNGKLVSIYGFEGGLAYGSRNLSILRGAYRIYELTITWSTGKKVLIYRADWET